MVLILAICRISSLQQLHNQWVTEVFVLSRGRQPAETPLPKAFRNRRALSKPGPPAQYGNHTRYKHIVERKDACVGDHPLKLAHLAVSLLKRWLLGTHQGAVSHEHLGYYLDEFVFRFNRRTSTHRGLLFLRLLQNSVLVELLPYKNIVKHVRGPKSGNHKM